MIRKIAADALRPGMYVHDLCCSWVDHPFLLNRFTVRDDADVEKILDAGITEILIDTGRGADVASSSAAACEPIAQVGTSDSKPAPETAPGHRQRAVAQPKARGEPVAVTSTSSPPIASSHTTNAIAAGTTSPRPVHPGGTGAGPPDAMPSGSRNSAPHAELPTGTAEHAAQTVEQVAGKQPETSPEAPDVMMRGTTAAEFQEARRVHAESVRVIREILTDVRLGKQVSIERTHAVVARMAEAILRKPGPLLALCRLNQKDEYTFLHCMSVSALLMVFAGAVGHDSSEVNDAGIGGLLHDIGKTKIPLATLNKAGRLTQGEKESVRRHVALGMDILHATPGVSPLALKIAAEHHERYDGTGYPSGLKGTAISRIGQMASIVDVYDAITSDRVYHRGLTPADALKQLLAGAGTQFATEPVQLFIKTLGIYPTGSLVMLESGRLAIVVDQSSDNLLQPRVRVVYDTRKAAFVPPFDVHLARTAGHGGEDRILRHESPLKWSVDPLAYLLEDRA